MKPWQIGAAIAGVGLAAVGISAIATNPGPAAYEEYAVEKLAVVLSKECQTWAQKDKGDGWVGLLQKVLQGGCPRLVESSKPWLRGVVAENTQRQNYLILSVYRTELSVSELIPGLSDYELEAETIGIYRRFFIIKAEQK